MEYFDAHVFLKEMLQKKPRKNWSNHNMFVMLDINRDLMHFLKIHAVFLQFKIDYWWKKYLELLHIILEPVCCKKQQEKVPDQILNSIKLILDDQENHLDSYTISLELFRSFRGPLFRKPVTGQELFFPVFYSKPALIRIIMKKY